MEENTKINKDYIEAFNQGYQLSKELNLKPEILNGINAGNNRIQAMKDGMEQYEIDREMNLEKTQNKEIIPPLNMETLGSSYVSPEFEEKNKKQTKDIDIDMG